MKCIILAGGTGDKMLPLSRREYPRQFINIRENRSLLQETVSRNMPLCEEVFIMANAAHDFIIDEQMEVFQGLKYRTFYEEEAKGTAFPIVMAALSCNPSERLYVLNADHFADGSLYQAEIMKATDLLKAGKMVAFGMQKTRFKSNYDYFFFDKNDENKLKDVLRFGDEADYIRERNHRNVRTLVNTGLFLCIAGDFLNDLKKEFPDYYNACKAIHKKLKTSSRNIYISKELLKDIVKCRLENILYRNLHNKVVVEPDFYWSEVTPLECEQPEDNAKELIKLAPSFKDYLWGGTRLRDIYGKKCDYDKIAESWELSAHEAGSSDVASGKYKGRTFTDYLEKIGKKALGWKAESFDRFPILIKFIDARDDLSVQVHPGDEFALKNEGELGKNEMWYIVDCADDSYVYWGLNCEITTDQLQKKIEDGTVTEVLNKVIVKKGDVIFVQSGTIHAIGKGILLCEVQQNSNCTYRFFDYGRKDRYGNLRELHLDKAMTVLDLSQKRNLPKSYDETVCKGYRKTILASCKYFQCEKYDIEDAADIPMDLSSFKSFVFIEGTGSISDGTNTYDIKPLDTYFMPATDGTIRIEGNCTVLVTRI